MHTCVCVHRRDRGSTYIHTHTRVHTCMFMPMYLLRFFSFIPKQATTTTTKKKQKLNHQSYFALTVTILTNLFFQKLNLEIVFRAEPTRDHHVPGENQPSFSHAALYFYSSAQPLNINNTTDTGQQAGSYGGDRCYKERQSHQEHYQGRHHCKYTASTA